MNWNSKQQQTEARVAFYTLGCKVNQQETASMRTLFEQSGYISVPFEEEADVYVVNTCTVTQESDRKSRNIIARAHARNKNAKIAVVGCYAQRAAEELAALPGVQVVIGTQNRIKLVELLQEANEPNKAVEDIRFARSFETLPEDAERGIRTRAQLKIQDGCDRYCSYCIIPYVRGPVRSRPAEHIYAELCRLGEAGVREVVLTGIHLMSYGKENKALPKLADIIKMCAATPGLGRIRLGSLDPSLVDDAFIEGLRVVEAQKLCEQFHLSLQSGSAAVLQAMRRKYTPAEYAAVVDKLRKAFPACAITTDVIAGFPGETQKEHEESMAFVKELALARLHVFPYSRREGTVAYDLPGQVIKSEKLRRANDLIALGKELEQAYVKSRLGSVQQVLVEKRDGQGVSEGYAGNYLRGRFAGGQVGELSAVRLISGDGDVVEAEALP